MVYFSELIFFYLVSTLMIINNKEIIATAEDVIYKKILKNIYF